MKKLLFVLSLILMSIFIVSCGGDSNDKDSHPETVWVTLDLDGGECDYLEEFECEYGEEIDLQNDVTVEKEGFAFRGWYVGNKKAKFPYEVTEDVTFKARWAIIIGGSTETDTATDDGSDSEMDTSSDSDTSTDTSTSKPSDSSSDTSTDYVPPLLDHDTINYEAKYSKDGKKIYYGSYSFKVPVVTEYYNDLTAALSMTFDDGADLAAAQLASSIMSEYGLKGTLMVNTGNIQGNISKWQELVALGTLDIGSHGWAHKDPNTISASEMEHEIKDSYDFLQQYFPDENPVTYATPLSHLTEAYKQYLIDTGFIANRLEIYGSMIAPSTENPDLYQLYAKRIDTGNNVETNVRINVSDALSAGKWFIELFHNVRIKDGTDVSEEDFRNHCKWLYDNYKDTVWFASYDDVCKYIVQRQTATIEYTACDKESMTFLAKVDKDYGQEMTLKFYLPFFIDSAYAVVNGEEHYLTLEKGSNVRTAYLNTCVSEEGTEIKIYLGGNDKYYNNCTHDYQVNKVVNPTANSFGYTEMICKKEGCGNTYKSQFTDKVSEASVAQAVSEIETVDAIVSKKEDLE
ncbi:MAG: polysaccharide deacetylase family protein [Clostridia bacterium]|nr:polysaccharide deacetylase family protein [Clostridia bacterium]